MITVPSQQEASARFDQIAYCCLASPHVNALRLVSDLSTHPAGITGLLIWEGRLLIQWLEGSAQQIEALWAQVQADVQQYCVVRLLHRQGTPQRLFTDWQMRQISRQEMMKIVREVKAQAAEHNDAHALPWQHAINTLSILLNPELTRFYATPAQAEHAVQKPVMAKRPRAAVAC